MQNYNFDNVKIIKKLSAGMLGTTYLCEYKNKEYALKIQHILEKDQYKDYSNELWRELDLYKYISKMPSEDQLFFTRLYNYKIYNDCTHKQIRPFKIDMNDKKNEFAQRLKKLDESEWCVKYLLEYKGKLTLGKFLIKYWHKLNLEQIYSILMQIIHIIMLLKKGGYSHNDLHTDNIMINKTNKKYFVMNGIKIKYNGYQLSAIDYGEVLHKKFNMKYNSYTKRFIKDNKQWYFMELYNSLMVVISNFTYLMNYCKKLNKKLPWEKNPSQFSDGLKLIFKNHIDFCDDEITKYIEMFPKGKKAIKKFYRYYKTSKSVDDIIKKEDIFNFYNIINRITIEFELTYPKLYKKYFGWCCETKWLLPKDECLQIILIDNTEDLIDFFVSKVLKN